jgi:CheY-like chemotaxis protein
MTSDSGIRHRPSVPAGRRNPDALDVVVVDDDPRWREYASEPFLKRGDRVRATADGLEALAQCLNDPPDIILTDVNMPRMDGWQLLRMVRARPQLASVPVIFLTALDGDAERLKGYQLGVDAYIPKPFVADELLMRVHRVVRRNRLVAAELEKAQTFRGDLEHVSPSSLLSFLAVDRQNGVLLLVGEQVARVFLRDGRPLRVEIEGALPIPSREALLSLLGWTTGQFEFSPQEVHGNDEIKTAVSALLLEHARMTDERRR